MPAVEVLADEALADELPLAPPPAVAMSVPVSGPMSAPMSMPASMPVAMPPPSRRLLVLAVVVSGVLHAAAAAAFLVARQSVSEYGVLPTQTDAMSLEQQQSVVLDSTQSQPVDAAAASAAMPDGTVVAVDARPEPLAKVEDVPEAREPPLKTLKAEEAPDSVQDAEEPLDVVRGGGEPAESLPAKKLPAKAQQQKPKQEKARKDAEDQHSKRQTAGGPTARASTSSKAASGRASASSGNVLSYAARVRAKVASNRPSGSGRGGTASVSFGVSMSGGLSYVRLARSSGNAALDQAALAAVRRAAPFGPPPAGASPGQLRFSIPFYFR